MSFEQITGPIVIGHRGACGYAPENTLASIRKAAQLGVQWVEFDVKLTQCNTLILMHDDSVSRTTNGRGLVAATTYADLLQLDAGSWFDASFKGEIIPTLQQTIQCLQQNNLNANIEIKASPGQEEVTARKTVECLLDNWPETKPWPVLTSFSLKSIKVVRQMAPQLPIGLLLSHWYPDWQKDFSQLNCVSLHVDHKMIHAETLRTAQFITQNIFCYTVNTAALAQQLFAQNIRGVFSDFPDRIQTVLAES